jgi:hypothetical protein
MITAANTRRPTVSFIQPPIVHEDIPSTIDKQRFFVPPVVPSFNTEQAKTTIEPKTSSIDPSKRNRFCFFSSLKFVFLRYSRSDIRWCSNRYFFRQYCRLLYMQKVETKDRINLIVFYFILDEHKNHQNVKLQLNLNRHLHMKNYNVV